MLSQFRKPLFITAGLLLFSSCSYNFPEENKENEVIDSPVDFSSFYVIGDTYVSGYMDGALYKGGQEYSYPNLVAGKLEAVFDKELIFQQATLENKNGYNRAASEDVSSIKGKFSLLFRTTNSIYPIRFSSEGQPIADWNGSLSDLNDFSFPHLKSFQINNGQKLIENSYAARLNLQSTPVVSLITEKDPGVVIISLGYDDILEYALNGASGMENPVPDQISANDLTPIEVFENALLSITAEILKESDAEVFLANIFNLLEAPYFSTISYALETERYSAGYISRAGNYYTEFNERVFLYNNIEDGGVPADLQRPTIIFDAQGYPMVNARNRARVIVDEYLSEAELNDGTKIPKWRQMKEGEIVLYKNEPRLNESSELSAQVPLMDEQVLTLPEIGIIKNRITAFNAVIKDLTGAQQRLHLIDMQQIINEIKMERYSFEGVVPSLKFERRGIFSADGYTLNPKGNAIIANQIIKAINNNFRGTLQPLNPNSYGGASYVGSEAE